MEAKSRPSLALEVDGAADLFGEDGDQFQPQSARAVDIEIGGDSNAVVGDLENDVASGGTQGHFDLPLPAVREGVFERIGDQFIDDQSARDRGVDAEGNVLGMNRKGDVVWIHPVGGTGVVRQSLEVFSDLDPPEVSRLIELFVEQRDGAHTTLALLEQSDGLRVGELIDLEVERWRRSGGCSSLDGGSP